MTIPVDKDENKSLIVAYCDEWYGCVYKCNKCNSPHIWRTFKYCPMCGVKLPDNFWLWENK